MFSISSGTYSAGIINCQEIGVGLIIEKYGLYDSMLILSELRFILIDLELLVLSSPYFFSSVPFLSIYLINSVLSSNICLIRLLCYYLTFF